jgi:CO/xanthine dehydrogenase Mo-binding subunit
VHIGEDGRITVFTGNVEIGQSIRTSLAQLVAEGLRVSVGIQSVPELNGKATHSSSKHSFSKPGLENA